MGEKYQIHNKSLSLIQAHSTPACFKEELKKQNQVGLWTDLKRYLLRNQFDLLMAYSRKLLPQSKMSIYSAFQMKNLW